MFKALIIDDSETALAYGKYMLERSGFRVSLADDMTFEDALDAQVFDLVLVDFHMPIRNGAECIAAIRSRSDRNARATIFLCSAAAGSDEVATASLAGSDGAVVKPLCQKELSEIETALRTGTTVSKHARQSRKSG